MKKKWLLLLTLYLGLHQGYLALWNKEKTDPVTVFPYLAALYPKMDQAALAEGIPADDPRELDRLIQDFLS